MTQPWSSQAPYQQPYQYQTPSTEPADDRPLGELFSDMTQSVQTLVRGEVQLAKAEISEQVSKASKAGALLGAGAVAGFVALLLVAFAAAWGLAEAIPVGLSFLAIALLFGVGAALLAVSGKQRLRTVRPVPRQTVETLRQDVDVAKTSFARGAHN